MTSLLSAEDLNDFIAPGVACIKEESVDNNGINHIELEFETDENGQVVDKSTNKKLQRAQISLNDCLACSGCITSMEEVLVAQHSHGEFLKAQREEKERIWVLSLSQQARASLASAFDVPINLMDAALGHVFSTEFGFSYIVSVNLGRELAYQQIFKEVKGNADPLLLSVCPGWVLYVEKTHAELIPSMSNVKSPQGITGAILKSILGPEVYHLSIMPCFDKKLEAARDKEVVDCVITPKEVVLLFEERGIDLIEVLERVDPLTRTKYTPPGWFKGNDFGWGGDWGSSSGGYAYNYLLEKQRSIPNSEIKIINGRNDDILELQLVSDNTIVAKSGVVNGFKNIQNMVRKLKPDASNKPVSTLLARRRRGGKQINEDKPSVDLTKCDLIEVMACPQGCINGGGQIKAPDGISNDEWVKRVKSRYEEEGINNEDIDEWVQWLGVQFNVDLDTLFKMEVKAVEKVKDDPMEMFTSTW